jgi:SAM-dependent methyltransferase
MPKRFNIRNRLSGTDERSTSKPKGQSQWDRFGLPSDMSGRSFLDVGCWEGRNCVEAVTRGARRVVGVDLCTSDELARNVQEHGFEFVQMDVLSEKWLALDTFDVVLCSGVLYHVENPLSLLFRLRRVTDELLVLETAIYLVETERPVLVLSPVDQRRNASNWWFPNKLGVFEMLKASGFSDVSVADERLRTTSGRLTVHAAPVRLESYDRVLPREPDVMSLEGGHRWRQLRAARRTKERDEDRSPD